MSYFDWQHLAKVFTFSPVKKDTVENTKALSITSVDYIKPNVVYLQIPATTFSNSGFAVPLIVGQFNYSVGTPVSIINAADNSFNTTNLTRVALALRYRIGSVVYRYLLTKTSSIARSLIPCPDYHNQPILGNFVIEVWQTSAGIPSINKSLFINTGRIYNPSSYEDTGNIIQPVQIVTLAQLQTALPATVDNYNTNGPWLTN